MVSELNKPFMVALPCVVGDGIVFLVRFILSLFFVISVYRKKILHRYREVYTRCRSCERGCARFHERRWKDEGLGEGLAARLTTSQRFHECAA